MPHSLAQVVGFASVPVIAMAGGGAIAAVWPPTGRIRSYIQHLAAGVVFSAASVEVLPDVMRRKAPIVASIGFAAGVALMLLIRSWARRVEKQGKPAFENGGSESWSMIGIVGVDVFVDGLLIGVMLATGERAGLLVTLALAVELLALGLATSATIGNATSSPLRALMATTSLAVVLAFGTVIGYLALGGLTGAWMEAMLAFALAALLYLVTEELLVEAHEVPETPIATAMFFAGFLLLLIVSMIT
jgi:zinc transporter, ZIP family